MSYVKNGTPLGGTSLPTASGAGQVPVSDGAGTAYTATSAGDVVDAAIASVVGAVAGQAIVGDGLGGVTETSADVSAVLAAANAAAARTALGVTTPSHTTGALAARPVSPAAGDTYAVTTGAQTGARYTCFVTGSWEGTVPFATGHSYERLAPATAGGGARFLDVDSLQLYTSSGDDAVRWGVELPGGLGPDAAGLTHNAGTIVSASTSLSGLAINTMTVACVFDWVGPGSGYATLFSVGNRSTGSIEAFVRRVGGDDRLIAYNFGASTPETTLTTFVGGLPAGIHRVTLAPITGNLWRWSFDGSAVADTAMASTWAALPASAPIGVGTSAIPDSPLLGRSIAVAIWPSLLSSSDIDALATAPSPETYRLAVSASTGVPQIHAEANRYDPTFPLVLPARGLTVPMAVGSAVRKYAYP